MVRILEKPAALSFSGNLTKFLVESDQPFAFSLKKKSAASSIFEHTYYPGTDKRSRIDVSNIIEDYLYFTLQANTNVHLQPNIKGVFVAMIDTQTVEFEVIRGGISNLADTTTNWLKHNFLTWQPIEKNVTYHSPEWISWYAVSTCALMLDATFEDQSHKSIKITDCQPGNVYTANLQYGYIAGLLGKLPSYYDVYLLYTDSQKSQVQRYLASDPKSEDEIYAGWENSLGGYDVARMSGYSTFENEGKHEVGSNGDSLEEYNTELSKKHVCNTGLMTLNERFWFVDFFISKRRHVYIDNAMREIVLSEDKGSIDTAETIDGLSFTFREKEDSKYLNVPRLRELPSDITIPVPSLPDFNLPPRLVEYARITLDEGVLFPAQHPSSQTCGVTTWGAMSTIINKWITDAIAGIKFPDIPDIPETLPPSKHTHEIEEVNQLKTELERRLLKAVFDENFSVSDALVSILKDLKVNGSGEFMGNLIVKDEAVTYSLDGIQLPYVAASSEYLNDLLDVTISNPLVNQYLKYNGDIWINSKISYADLIDTPSISAWALAATKPSYNWSEINSKPESFPPAQHYHNWDEISSKPSEFNPTAHTHTKSEVGLGNVDNTSDANKPVSDATAKELLKKLDKIIFDENFNTSEALVEVLKSLKVNGNEEVVGNLKVKGETTTYSLDGVEVSSSSISGTQYLWELADIADTVKDAVDGSMLVKSGSQWQHVETISIDCGNYKII